MAFADFACDMIDVVDPVATAFAGALAKAGMAEAILLLLFNAWDCGRVGRVKDERRVNRGARCGGESGKMYRLTL